MRLRRLEPVIRRALAGACRVRPGSRVLVAVSGGADSTALLVALHSLAHERGLELVAAHLNHRLRGATSDADQAFVAELCTRLGVPLVTARWDTRARMKRRGLSGENGLRTLRREFLDRAALRADARCIATAHTADDQLETVLLRLARGTGLRGAGGMRPRAGKYIKPMLEATRADVEADLRRAKIDWREDATNAEPRYARNRVRHDVVPALMAATSDTRAALARRVVRLAAELREAERALTARTAPLVASAVAGRGAEVPLAVLAQLHRAERRALWRAIWQRVARGAPGLTAAHLDAIECLSRTALGPVGLPGGYTAVSRNLAVRLLRGSIQALMTARDHGAVKEWSSPLAVPGCIRGAGLRIAGGWTTRRRALDQISVNAGSEEYFDAEGVQGGLVVRIARADDEFVPFGRRRPVRLREFLKRSPERHRSSPSTVLADDRGILWVIGVRRSARAPVSPTTRRVLRVHAERHD